MSVIPPYTPPGFLFSPHLETIYPSLFRKVQLKPYERERITTPDNDFLDLDWLKQGSRKLIIISHGLEGNSTRAYIKGMAKPFFENGYDIMAWNFRGCSEELNKQLRFYHSGATEDLRLVVDHGIRKDYDDIYLIGFSLGGNLTLKYLGEEKPPHQVKRAVAISVPLDLKTSCEKISRPSNWVYSRRFLRSLKSKVIAKSKLMPELDTTGIQSIKTLTQFDDRFTAPIHGFDNAIDYYTKCSSIKFVSAISTPTLIINTKNDPFLSKECFPIELLKDHPYVVLEILLRGGHVGFTQFNKNGLYWSEERAFQFIHTS